MARVIARKMNLEIKIGEIEYQGDLKKITFYFTAEGRIDFRELVKEYARTFKAKIEMRQIGLRQESGKIGGIGSCGRELCCSTWLTDFKSVSTNVARYQNLSINSARLSGQCGRLKCCLNYELDTYVEALGDFPKDLDFIKTNKGIAKVVKTDILNRLIYFSYKDSQILIPKSVANVNLMLADIEKGSDIEEIIDDETVGSKEEKLSKLDHSVGHISLRQLEKKKKQKRPKGRNQRKGQKKGNF